MLLPSLVHGETPLHQRARPLPGLPGRVGTFPGVDAGPESILGSLVPPGVEPRLLPDFPSLLPSGLLVKRLQFFWFFFLFLIAPSTPGAAVTH